MTTTRKRARVTRRAPGNRRAAAAAMLEAPKPLGDTKPTIYIDVIGTLVLQEGAKFRVAPFAREFVAAIKQNNDLILLTDLSEPAATNVARTLDFDATYGHYRKGLGKSSGIDFDRAFLWIDDAPTSRDLMRLSEERRSGHLVTVNGRDGVTRVTLDKVENCLENLRSGQRLGA